MAPTDDSEDLTDSARNDCETVVKLMAAGDPDLDPVWGLLVGGGKAEDPINPTDDGEVAVALMTQGDPDLDPVWGLLTGAGDGASAEARTAAALPLADSRPISERLSSYRSEISRAEARLAAADAAVQAALTRRQETAQELETWRKLLAEVELESQQEEQEDDGNDVPAAVTAPAPVAGKRPISNVVDKAEVCASLFRLLPDAVLPPVTRHEVNGCDAFYLDGVLTLAECAKLIEQANGHWSFWDDSERPRIEFRNAFTVEVTHHELADRIWQRVGHLVNPSLTIDDEDDPRFEVDIEGTWRPYAMNPKKLFSRYLNGGHFAPHTDGTTVVDFNRRTFYSCVLFLNASPWGGGTRMYSNDQIGRELVKDSEGRLTGDAALVLDEVPPSPGRMLVFYHRLMHEGVPAAEKYIIRSDVLYHRTPEICTAPEDVEAFAMYEEAQLRAEHGEVDAAAQLFRRAFKRSPALAKVYRS
eukprot:gnl/TRDRNA2_/TRDRNA2_80808_c0_seq1.p1 gnl/TRDRNA2_/TRDRNA2_80808_c0~~gnl/TRDRNA2_/TRDRNA2_80808_c0_seq1.p1  ORF type:complete len:502 (+),score=87.79 gnl/TRDRNA2_/TRDRNA2_80808_c0_seq1:91-1506(+)